MSDSNDKRRKFLIAGTSFIAGAAAVGIAVPFVQSWRPSARAMVSGANVKVNTKKIESGAIITVEWQRKPVWVLRRTSENIENLKDLAYKNELRDPDSELNQQPDYAKNDFRSIKPDIFVAVGVCTHLGCIPLYKPEGILDHTRELFFCPCHGSKYDLSGRVFKNVPAPFNLIIPPYRYLTDDVVEIGIDENTVT